MAAAAAAKERKQQSFNTYSLLNNCSVYHYCLAILVSLQTIAGNDLPSKLSADQARTFKSVVSSCASKVDTKTIREYKLFVEQIQEVAKIDQANYDKELKSMSKKEREAFRWCLDGLEPLLELARLVDGYDKVRPCKYSEVSKLEAYAVKFLSKKSKTPPMKFFTLFGVNVGINCKLNLLAHLRQADLESDPMDFIYSLASPTGWNVLINEQTKKSMKFGSSSHASNQIVHKIARLVPGLSQIEQLDYLNFNHPMNDQQARDKILQGGLEAGEYQLLEEAFRPKVIESLEKIIESCQNLDQFYVNSILSLAKLNELGLLVGYLNDFHEPSLAQHKWLAASGFCQLMTRVKLQSDAGQQKSSVIKFEIVHNDQLVESRRQLYSYVAKFDEIGDQARELAWRASVSGGQWKQKSDAMFRPDQNQSVAMRQVKQYFKGVEQNFKLAQSEDE